MKVLHIGKYFPPYFGGIEKVNYDIVEGLFNRKVHVDVLCFNHEKFDFVDKSKYTIFRSSLLFNIFSTPFSISFFFKFREIKNKYDIIHVHLPNPIPVLAILLIGFKGKIVVHWHSDIVKQKFLKKFYGPIEKLFLKKADLILLTSNNYLMGSSVVTQFAHKSQVIPIGINSYDFVENLEFRKQLCNDISGKKFIFSLGRLIYYKGFDVLIESAKYLDEDCIIYIGGTGELRDELQNRIRYFNVEDKVKLVGNIPFDQLGEYYRRADVFCLPSNEKSEAFGVVLIEAMSFGCPLVCCDIAGSGVPWVNKDGETGFVVPTDSPFDLYRAIHKILSDDFLKEKFKVNAKIRFHELFERDTMVEKIHAMYKSLLN